MTMTAKEENAVLEQKLRLILKDGDKLSVTPGDGYLTIKYSRMYDAPTLKLDQLIALKKMFQCEDVLQSSFGYKGCDSCDWGSCYGYTITISSPYRYKKLSIKDE